MRYIFLLAFILMFAGCSGRFNPSVRTIVYDQGEAYYVPVNSRYLKMNANFVNQGLPCRINDTLWIAADKYNENDSISQIMLKMFQGYAGCSSTLTYAQVQQIRYYKEVQRIKEQIATQTMLNSISSSLQSTSNNFNQMSQTLSQATNSLSNYNQMQQLNSTIRDGFNQINQSIINSNGGYFGGGSWFRR